MFILNLPMSAKQQTKLIIRESYANLYTYAIFLKKFQIFPCILISRFAWEAIFRGILISRSGEIAAFSGILISRFFGLDRETAKISCREIFMQ